MAMPRAKGLFHRGVIESGPYLRFSPPDTSARLAAGVVAELGLAKGQIDQLQALPVGRISAAAAAALRKLSAPPGSSPAIRRDSTAIAWQPTVDGSLVVDHPFEPAALAVSAGIPLITGTNFHEFVNGVDNPLVTAMTDADLSQRVQAAYGDRAAGIIAAYRREYPQASPSTPMRPSPCGPRFARRPSPRRRARRRWAPPPRIPTCMRGARPSWTTAPASSTARRSRS